MPTLLPRGEASSPGACLTYFLVGKYFFCSGSCPQAAMSTAANQSSFRPEQREVTLLFADLRGSTQLVGTLQTDPIVCELLGHVMDCLSDAVAAYEGFIVDYFGDGMLAMWNAPRWQADHADLACDAALQMLASLPSVSQQWIEAIRTPLRVGIGVHTGPVLVGNAGSSRKVKYGPRGPNVHLASRVEAATKELGIPFVATQSTVAQLSTHFTANRVCRAQMPGLQEPIDLFVVRESTSNAQLAFAWQTYARALRRFECGDFNAAAESLATIDRAVNSVPRQFLLQRTRSEQSRSQRRRSTDIELADSEGVMVIAAK